MNEIFKTYIKIYLRKINDVLTSTIFFLTTIVFFPIAMGNDSKQFNVMLPPIIWINILIIITLKLKNIFNNEFDDGILEQKIKSPYNLNYLILIKIIIHWTIQIIPLLIICPIILLIFEFNFIKIIYFMVSLTMGTLSITFIGALSASLTITSYENSLIITIITLPLLLPVLIINTSIITLLELEYQVTELFLLSTIINVILITTIPKLISYIIKITYL